MERNLYWKRRDKKRKRKSIRKHQRKANVFVFLVIIIIIVLTDRFPSGEMEKNIDDIDDSQVVFVMIQATMSEEHRDVTLTVVNRQGKWKCVSTGSEEFDKIVGDRWDKIFLNLTADIVDDVYASELVPFQKGKINISNRSLEWAINQRGSVVEDYDYKWERKWDLVKKVDCHSEYYTVGGPKNRCLHKVGAFGYVENQIMVSPATLRLYLKFVEIDLRARRVVKM